VLGDNLLYGHGLAAQLSSAAEEKSGATVFAYQVDNPQRYGVIVLDADGRPTAIDEKPANPRSNWAVTGLYFFDETAPARARVLPRSSRGEYEITDLNASYLRDGTLKVMRLGRGMAWFDAGTHASLLEASEFVHVIQSRQRQLLASPEEIAYSAGWIDAARLAEFARQFGSTEYGKMLGNLLTARDCPT
jgi:glucose-1-phosphate thymidylyltransferase